jgi:hypothetical protein
MEPEIEGEDPAHVDVGMRDWGDLTQEFVGKLIRHLPRHDLHVLRVPGHDGVGGRRSRSPTPVRCCRQARPGVHLAAPAASATPLGARPDPLGRCVVAGRLGIRPRYEQSPLMLWWLIGVWLASGAVLPVLWLLSMAYRAASKRIGPQGLYVLPGLVSIGALVLLFVCPFGDSDITMRGMTSAPAVAQAPMTSAAEAKPIQ